MMIFGVVDLAGRGLACFQLKGMNYGSDTKTFLYMLSREKAGKYQYHVGDVVKLMSQKMKVDRSFSDTKQIKF